MSRLRIETKEGRKMNCEINPAIFDDIAQGIEAVALPCFIGGMITGAAFLYLVAQLWCFRRGE